MLSSRWIRRTRLAFPTGHTMQIVDPSVDYTMRWTQPGSRIRLLSRFYLFVIFEDLLMVRKFINILGTNNPNPLNTNNVENRKSTNSQRNFQWRERECIYTSPLIFFVSSRSSPSSRTRNFRQRVSSNDIPFCARLPIHRSLCSFFGTSLREKHEGYRERRDR
jgi:hypothetical protein